MRHGEATLGDATRNCHRPLGAVALALVLASCALGPGDCAPERLFSVGYRNLSERYIEAIDLGQVTLAGLGRLQRFDSSLGVAAPGDAITVTASKAAAGHWPAPGDGDVDGWARLTADAVEAVRAASPAARAYSPQALSNAVFHGVMSKFDRYLRYASPEVAARHRASREGFGGLGISIAIKDGVTRIRKVHRDTPAERAGLKPADRITHVDQRPLRGLA